MGARWNSSRWANGLLGRPIALCARMLVCVCVRACVCVPVCARMIRVPTSLKGTSIDLLHLGSFLNPVEGVKKSRRLAQRCSQAISSRGCSAKYAIKKTVKYAIQKTVKYAMPAVRM